MKDTNKSFIKKDNNYTKYDGYKKQLLSYIVKNNISYSELIKKCKNKNLNPFSASMARWVIDTYQNIQDQMDDIRTIVKKIINK